MTNPNQDALLAGDFAETRDVDELNAPIEWRGLPRFEAVERDTRLVLTFDTPEQREELIAQLGLILAKKTGQTWSAWWPPRDRDDLAALRFDFDAAEQGEPDGRSIGEITQEEVDSIDDAERDWQPAPDEEVPASWADHVGHQVALTYAHGGELIAARCSSCGVDLPPPDAVVEAEPPLEVPATELPAAQETTDGPGMGDGTPEPDPAGDGFISPDEIEEARAALAEEES
jgi:hypothetical protein